MIRSRPEVSAIPVYVQTELWSLWVRWSILKLRLSLTALPLGCGGFPDRSKAHAMRLAWAEAREGLKVSAGPIALVRSQPIAWVKEVQLLHMSVAMGLGEN
jgi:hypothetical protein